MATEQAKRLLDLLELQRARPELAEQLQGAIRAGFRAVDAEIAEDIERDRAAYLAEVTAPVEPDLAERLLARQVEARAALSHPDWAVRRLGLYALCERHDQPPDGPSLLRLASADPSTEVRRSAVFYLAVQFAGSRDSGVGASLARLILSEQEPREVRLDAYRALTRVHAGDRDALPSQFPEDVDWDLVARYASLPAVAS